MNHSEVKEDLESNFNPIQSTLEVGESSLNDPSQISETLSKGRNVKELLGDESKPNEDNIAFDLNRYSFIDFRANQILHILQFLCVLISCGGFSYFIYINHLYVALEYFQVCFISSIVVVLDNTNIKLQIGGLIASILVAIGWSVTYFIANTSNVPEELLIAATIISATMSLLFLGGLICMTYVITEISSPNNMRCIELDLVLYLVALTAICFFSTNEFNNNLHMILDIRLMVTLYSGLYQEKDKMKLLRIPSFLLNMTLIIISFMFFAIQYPIFHIIANSFYIVIGCLFIYEARWKRINWKKINNP